MTRANAVMMLRRYLREEIPKYDIRRKEKSWKGRLAFFKQFFAEDLQKDILASDRDPILVVRGVYAMLEDALVNSGDFNPRFHTECSTMIDAVYDILLYVQGKNEERRKSGSKKDIPKRRRRDQS